MGDKNSQNNAFMTAVMGAAVGAAAVLLSDKKTRDSLKKKVTSFIEGAEELKEKGKDRLQEEVQKTKSKVRKMASE